MATTTRALRRGGRLPAPLNQVTGTQWLILLVVLLGMAVIGNYAFRRTAGDGAETAVTFQTGAVGRRTIESTVSATGTIAATRQLRVAFPQTGQVQDVLVKQGDRVETGQPLATLNTQALDIKRDQARTNLATAQFRLEALLAGPTGADVAAAQQTVATAQSTLTRAQNDLFNLLAGPSVDEVAQARTAVERSQANLFAAQVAYDRIANRTDLTLRPEYTTLQQARSTYQAALTNLSNRTAPPNPLDVSTAEASVATAQAALDSARAKLSQLLSGPDPLDLGNAQQALAGAQSSLDSARAKLNLLLAGPDPLELANARAASAGAQASLESARAKLAQVLVGPDPLEVTAAEAQVSAARSSLSAAQAKLRDLQNPTLSPTLSIELAALEAQVASARMAISAAQERVTDTIQAGDPSARASASAALASAQAQLATAQSNFARASAPTSATSAEVLAAQQGVSAAEATLSNAENNLRKLQQGPATADLSAAQQGVAAAESQVTSTGNAIARLLLGPTAADLAAAQQGVAAAETQVTTATNAITRLQLGPTAADLAAAQQTIAAAEGQLTTARNNLDKILAGALPDDIAAARAALDSAQAALDTAQTNWDRLASGTDIETRPEYTQLMTARADYQAALTSYNTKVQGPKETDVASAQATVDSANAVVNGALARLAQVLGGALPTDIGIQREAIANAELALRQTQNDLDNATLKAPFRGTIVSVGINPGDQVGASTTPFTLLDPELVRIDATVDESNVIKLKQGMPVVVTFDALQGRQFQGVVATVTPSGVTTQGVTTFPVGVVFNAQGNTIPPGTTANLRVVTESKPGVLVVPSRAIQRQGRTSFVEVLVNGKPEQREVQTGITGDNVTEILAGIQEGETIVIPSQQRTGQQTGAFGAGGLPGLGAGAPAPAQQPAQQPAQRR